MNTTELFVEQVLAGLLVLLTGGLVFNEQLHEVYRDYVGSEGYLEQIIASGVIVSAAYLIGMVYDRVADTLLQDVESHCRLRFAFSEYKPDNLVDPFEEGKYRIGVLRNEQATAHMEYLRSRIRLTRALTVAIPGLMVALLLAMEGQRLNPWWALTIPLVYLAVLITKLVKRRELFERPPKTYQTERLRDYYIRRARLIPNACGKTPFRWDLMADEVWIGLVLLLGFASVLILSTGSYGRLWVPATGLLLTLLVGWTWWRISITFYAFLRDYDKYKDKSV